MGKIISRWNAAFASSPVVSSAHTKEIYALACVFGGVVFWLCGHLGIGGAALQVITAVAVIAARIVAVYFGLKLPTLRASGSQEP